MKALPRLLPLLILSFFLSACPTPEPDNVGITIAPQSSNIQPGKQITITANVTGTNQQSVTWSASKGKIEGTSNTISYTAPLQTGEYQVTATSTADANKRATTTIYVDAVNQTRITSIIIEPQAFVTLEGQGDSHQLSATVYDNNGKAVTNAQVTWSSTDPSAVSITNQGLIKAETGFGSTQITAQYQLGNQVITSAPLSVSVAELAPNSVLISNADLLDFTIQDIDKEIATLIIAKNANTNGLKVNDILISESTLGLIAKILNISTEGNTFRVTVQQVPAEQAYHRLSFRSSTGIDVQSLINNPQLQNLSDSISVQGNTIFVQGLRDLDISECESQGNLVPNIGIKFTAVDLEINTGNMDLVRFQAKNFGLFNGKATLDMGVDWIPQVKVTFGKAEFPIGVKRSIICKARLLEIPFQSILTPLGVTIQGIGEVGGILKLEAEANAVNVTATLEGPSFSFKQHIVGGIKYTEPFDFSTYNYSTEPERGSKPPQLKFKGDVSAGLHIKGNVDIGLYLDGALSLKTTLFNKEIASFDFFELHGTLRLAPDFTILNFQDFSETLKNRLTFGGNIQLKLQSDTLNSFTKLINRIKIGNFSPTIPPLDLTLFEYNAIILELSSSAKDLLTQPTLSTASVKVGEKVEVSLNAFAEFLNIRLPANKIVLFRNGKMLGEARESDIPGKFTFDYVPTVQDVGSYTIKAQAYYLTIPIVNSESEALSVQQETTPKVCEGNFVIDGVNTAEDIAKVRDCTEIKGDLHIYNTNLTNLFALSKLQRVEGSLCIGCYLNGERGNPNLTSLSGLDNLSFVGKHLAIRDNDALTTLSGLGNVSSVGAVLSVRDNNVLTNLSGLGNISSVGGDLSIAYNASLTSLSGLQNIASVGGLLAIWDNDVLTNLSGLDSVSSVGGDLAIKHNDALTSLSGLEKLKEVKGTRKEISNNPKFDCSPYNQNAPSYFPLTHSTSNKVNCTTSQTPNVKPTADFTFTPAAPVAGQAVTFNAKAHSSDSAVKYGFNFGDGSNSVVNTTGTATHTFAAAGSYNVRLQVEDAKGIKSETKVKVVQVQANANPQDWKLLGNASMSNGRFIITPDAEQQNGAIWNKVDKLDFTQDFQRTFMVYLGNEKNGEGGDGIVLALLKDIPSRQGAAGAFLGFGWDELKHFESGNKTPLCNQCIGIELDSFYNSDFDPTSSDHIALVKNGSTVHTNTVNKGLPYKAVTLADGKEHKLSIVWAKSTKNLAIYLDDALMFNYAIESTTDTFGSNVVHYGFTGATWSATNLQYFKPLP